LRSVQVQRLALGRLAVDRAQDFDPLRTRMPVLALAHDLAMPHVERRGQRGRAEEGSGSRRTSDGLVMSLSIA
jgi:hypothetical protein